MPDDTTERFSQAWWEQRLPQRLNGTSWQTIGEAEGIPEPTMRRNRRKAEQSGWIPVNESLPAPMKSDGRRASSRKKRPQETIMSDDVVAVHDADTAPAEVHYGAVQEFDALPEGYAKVIQPMRPYTDAEEWALNRSIELYGFIGTIVYDQYGRILDGNQRQRVARLRGLGAPFTKVHVRDDAHAIEIARSLNAVRRQYSREERERLALEMRDHGFSYRAIADALGVGVATVYRDVFGVLRIRPESEEVSAPVPDGTPNLVKTDSPVPDGTPHQDFTPETGTTERPVPTGTPEPEKHIRGRDGKLYRDKQPNGTKAKTSPADRQLAQVINLLMSHAQQWSDQHWQAFLEVVQNLRGGREPAISQTSDV